MQMFSLKTQITEYFWTHESCQEKQVVCFSLKVNKEEKAISLFR